MNETARHPLRRGDRVHPQPQPRHLLQQRHQLQLGNSRPDAAVYAVAEGQVPPRVRAVNDDPLAILEHTLVAIGREGGREPAGELSFSYIYDLNHVRAYRIRPKSRSER